MDPIKFSRLTISGWRQFGEIDLQLHPRLTVLTGANGAGKSTLLNVFSSHFDYQRPLLATPRADESGGYKYFNGIISFFSRLVFAPAPKSAESIGELTYSNNSSSPITVPINGGVQYDVSIHKKQQVHGFHVSSHRRLPQYQQVDQIPAKPMAPKLAYERFNGEMMSSYRGEYSGYSSTYRIKETLLSMALLGPQTEFNSGNAVLRQTFVGFSDTLKNILPEEIGFLELSIRSPDVVFVTKSGEFLIDAISGGLLALVDLAWQIYMYSVGSASFVVTIDEPENHLHPSMQRVLMGNLISTFPNVQFIVASHSPFIVSAVRDARVYVLKHMERNDMRPLADGTPNLSRLVSSVCLDSVNRAGTASQILRDVLGLPTTYPDWVSAELDVIIEKYRGRQFDEKLMYDIRKELSDSGYGELLPDVTLALARS